MPVFPQLTEEERWRSTFALMPPTLNFGTAPDQAFFFIVRPKTADTIDLEIGYLFHPDASQHPMFDHLLEMSDAGVQVFVQAGPGRDHEGAARMHSRFAARGRYSCGRRRATCTSTAGSCSATRWLAELARTRRRR